MSPRSARDPLHAAVALTLGQGVSEREVVRVLGARRLRIVVRALVAALYDGSSEATTGDELRHRSDDELVAILRSPEVCEALRTRASPAELRRCVDLVIGHVRDRERGILPSAPVMACGLRVEDTLPVVVGRPSAGLVEPRRLEAAATRRSVDRLDAAMAALATWAPLGHEVLTDLVDGLVLRVDLGRPAECWGATSGIAIGRVVVVNPEQARSTLFLAEVLLHEATHVALDLAELGQPLVDPATAGDRSIPSPWTGAPLTAHAYVHAAVVWSVLAAFWKAVLDDGEAPGGLARQRSILAGFLRLGAQDLLAATGASIRPETALVLDAARRSVRHLAPAR